MLYFKNKKFFIFFGLLPKCQVVSSFPVMASCQDIDKDYHFYSKVLIILSNYRELRNLILKTGKTDTQETLMRP